MDYECQLSPIYKTAIDAVGVTRSLCDNCRAPDCTNPIREYAISLFGVPVKSRLWVVNNQIRQVIACKGYIGEQDVVSDAQDEIKTDTGSTI